MAQPRTKREQEAQRDIRKGLGELLGKQTTGPVAEDILDYLSAFLLGVVVETGLREHLTGHADGECKYCDMHRANLAKENASS